MNLNSKSNDEMKNDKKVSGIHFVIPSILCDFKLQVDRLYF